MQVCAKFVPNLRVSLPSPTGVSTTSTIPASDDSASANAAPARKQLPPASAGELQTPPDKIRRRNTLPEDSQSSQTKHALNKAANKDAAKPKAKAVADKRLKQKEAILAIAKKAAVKSKCKAKAQKAASNAVNKKKQSSGKSNQQSTADTDIAAHPEAASSGKQPAEEAVSHKEPALAPKADVQTPPTEKRHKTMAKAVKNNLTRPASFANTPSPPASKPSSPDTTKDAKPATSELQHEEQEQRASPRKGSQSGSPKKRKREKTAAEKAMHAKFMRFSRSLQSPLGQS